LVDFISEWTEH
jgi:ribonuclease HI